MRVLAILVLCAASTAAAQVPAAPSPSASPGGSVEGAVRGLNLARGIVTVQSGPASLTLNADPGQLAPLDAGDPVAFPYVSYEGALWLSPEATRGEIGEVPAPAESQGKLTGTIRRMQLAQGTITVRGVTFRIHPSRLEGLVPGQLVTLTYVPVGQTTWVADLQPLARRPRPIAPPVDAPAPEGDAAAAPASGAEPTTP